MFFRVSTWGDFFFRFELFFDEFCFSFGGVSDGFTPQGLVNFAFVMWVVVVLGGRRVAEGAGVRRLHSCVVVNLTVVRNDVKLGLFLLPGRVAVNKMNNVTSVFY